MLAFNVYTYNQGAPSPINLKGILVGNGCIGQAAGVCGSSPYGDYLSLAQFHGHAFLSDKAFEAAVAACGDWSGESAPCRAAVNAASDEVGTNFDVYDLYSGMWGTCNYGNRLRRLGRRVAPHTFLGRLLAAQRARLALALANNSCTTDSDLTTYLNLPAVQAALHVKAKTWEECGGIVYDSEMVRCACLRFLAAVVAVAAAAVAVVVIVACCLCCFASPRPSHCPHSPFLPFPPTGRPTRGSSFTPRSLKRRRSTW